VRVQALQAFYELEAASRAVRLLRAAGVDVSEAMRRREAAAGHFTRMMTKLNSGVAAWGGQGQPCCCAQTHRLMCAAEDPSSLQQARAEARTLLRLVQDVRRLGGSASAKGGVAWLTRAPVSRGRGASVQTGAQQQQLP
jgi:hypothetical protein